MSRPARSAPSVPLRRLAALMVQLRVRASLTQVAAAQRIRVSRATITRLEGAEVRPQQRTLIDLLELYGAQEDDYADAMALYEAAAQPQVGWLARADLPEEYSTYIEFESGASSASVWAALVVPGLLQTPDYARALIVHGEQELSEPEIAARLAARMARQGVLHRNPPLELHVIIDEAVLRRQVGSAHVMRAQLDHLVAMATRPHVALQVMPEDAEAHVGLNGAFLTLEFRKHPPIVYLQYMGGNVILDAEGDTNRFGQAFGQLRKLALDKDASVTLIQGMASAEKGTN